MEGKTRERTGGIAITNTTTITARTTPITITTVPIMRAMNNNITTTDNKGDKKLTDEIEERAMEPLCIDAERTMSPRPEATLH